jgi:hypothetical protein
VHHNISETIGSMMFHRWERAVAIVNEARAYNATFHFPMKRKIDNVFSKGDDSFVHARVMYSNPFCSGHKLVPNHPMKCAVITIQAEVEY